MLDDQSLTLEFCAMDTGIGNCKGQVECGRCIFILVVLWRDGVGLSISKRLVSFMQGNMWVKSEVSKDSRFYFTITSQAGLNDVGSLVSSASLGGDTSRCRVLLLISR